MKIFTVIALFVLLVAFHYAAKANTNNNTSLWGIGRGDAIELRWLPSLENPFPAEGYTVLRRRRGGITTFYPIATIIVKPEINDSLNIQKSLRDSVYSLLNKIKAGEQTRSFVEELRLSDMAHPAVFNSLFNFRFIDSTARANTRYDYQLAIGIDVVAQVNDVGRLTAPPLLPPDAKAVAVGNSIRLAWESRGMLSKGVCGWKIMRRQDDKPEEQLQTPILAAFFPDNQSMPYLYEDAGLKKGSHYYYRIISFDIFGRESAPGSEIDGFVVSNKTLSPPIGIAARISGEQIKISWRNLLRKQGGAIGFHVYRREGNRVSRLTNTPIADTFFTDKPEQISSTEIAYFTTVIDAEGNESAPSLRCITAVPDNTPPVPPNFAGVSPDADVLIVHWTKSASNDVAYYEVARSAADNGVFSLVSEPIYDTVFTDSTGQGAAWWYKIRAIDMRGNKSNWTISLFGKSQGVDILPPTPVIISAISSDRLITLRWTPVSFLKLAGYWVNRYDDTTYTPITVNSKIIPPTQTSYEDQTCEPGVLRVYEIVAQDSNLSFSQPSARAYGRCFDSRSPTPPVIDSILIADLGVVIIWKWDSKPYSSYEVVVERSLDNKRYVQVSPLIGPDIYRYSDYAIRSGDTYYYRLRALSKRGVWSSPSASRSIVINK